MSKAAYVRAWKTGFWIASQAWKQNISLYDAYLIGGKKNFHFLASSREQVCNHELQQLETIPWNLKQQ